MKPGASNVTSGGRPENPMMFQAFIGFGLALILAFAVRMVGLAEPSLSHPEIYIPGVELPPGISEPPPRFEFFWTLSWHFHREPHPIGYYFGMWGWTTIFGDSHFALRLPNVLFAIGSVFLVYKLGALVFNRWTGVVSALMLAAHGTHIYWSTNARPYVPGAFFGILATWLLLKIASERNPHPFFCAAYVAAIVSAIQTTELSWALFGIHMGWVLLIGGAEKFSLKDFAPTSWLRWRAPRLAFLQASALILSLPSLLHSAYQARRGAGEPPGASFLVDFAAFGYLFEPDGQSEPVRFVPFAVLASVAVFSIALAYLGARDGKDRTPRPDGAIEADMRPLIALAIAVAVLMAWMGSIAHKRNEFLMAMSVMPILALAVPVAVAMARPVLRSFAAPIMAFIDRNPHFASSIVLLAIFAPLILFAASFVASVLAARAFMVLAPYMLVLTAAGLVSLLPRRPIFAAAAAATAAIFAASIVFVSPRPNSPRDYQAIAEGVTPLMQEGDLVFVRHHDWSDTPLLYYLKSHEVISQNYASVIEDRQAERIWVFRWTDVDEAYPLGEMKNALTGFEGMERARALRARAILYTREEATASDTP